LVDSPTFDFVVELRLSGSRDARLQVSLQSSRQRPFLDRTLWPPLKASIKPGAFILQGGGMARVGSLERVMHAPEGSRG
jgi:hypothetical protein